MLAGKHCSGIKAEEKQGIASERIRNAHAFTFCLDPDMQHDGTKQRPSRPSALDMDLIASQFTDKLLGAHQKQAGHPTWTWRGDQVSHSPQSHADNSDAPSTNRKASLLSPREMRQGTVSYQKRWSPRTFRRVPGGRLVNGGNSLEMFEKDEGICSVAEFIARVKGLKRPAEQKKMCDSTVSCQCNNQRRGLSSIW